MRPIQIGATRPEAQESNASTRAEAETLLAAQAQVRRGLKAGLAVRDDARRAYLATQWTGEHDRRPERGLLVRTKL